MTTKKPTRPKPTRKRPRTLRAWMNAQYRKTPGLKARVQRLVATYEQDQRRAAGAP